MRSCVVPVQHSELTRHRLCLGSGPENAKAAEQLSKETGRTCLPVQADVRKPEDMKAAAKACVDKFGKLDFVICGEPIRFRCMVSL